MGIYDREYSREPEDGGGFQLRSPRTLIATLVVINVVVFVADLLTANDNKHWLKDLLALTPDTLTKPWMWWKFVTYGFAHSHQNVMHIVGNMIGLWFAGQMMEPHLGRKELLRFYLVSLVVCGVAWAGLDLLMTGPASRASLIGASGAVTAVVMLFVFTFPQATLMVWGVIPARAWVVGVVIVLLNIVGDRGRATEGAKVAYDVHLVGAAFAAIYFWSGIQFSRFWSFDFGKLWKKSKTSFGTGPKLRVHDPDDEEDDDVLDQQADRLLEKINRSGMESLTAAERKILEAHSRRVRARRR